MNGKKSTLQCHGSVGEAFKKSRMHLQDSVIYQWNGPYYPPETISFLNSKLIYIILKYQINFKYILLQIECKKNLFFFFTSFWNTLALKLIFSKTLDSIKLTFLIQCKQGYSEHT